MLNKKQAVDLAKTWRLGNKFRKKSLVKKHNIAVATSKLTGRVKLGIKMDIDKRPDQYYPALDDDGSLVFFTGAPMKKIPSTDLFTPRKAPKGKRTRVPAKENTMINYRLEILKTSFPSEAEAVLEAFLEKRSIDITNYSLYESTIALAAFKRDLAERTEFQLVAQKCTGEEVKSSWYKDENDLAELKQKCEDSDGYESSSVLKRIVDVDEDEEDTLNYTDGEKEETEAVDEHNDADMLKLTTLALKQIPGSPKQRETIKKLNVLRKKAGLKGLSEMEIDMNDEVNESVNEAIKFWTVTITKKAGKLFKGQTVDVKARNSAEAIKKGIKQMKGNPALVPGGSVDAVLGESRNMDIEKANVLTYDEYDEVKNFRNFNKKDWKRNVIQKKYVRIKKVKESTDLEENIGVKDGRRVVVKALTKPAALRLKKKLRNKFSSWDTSIDKSGLSMIVPNEKPIIRYIKQQPEVDTIGESADIEEASEKQLLIKDLKALIKNPDARMVKMYGGNKYVDMLKKKLTKLESIEEATAAQLGKLTKQDILDLLKAFKGVTRAKKTISMLNRELLLRKNESVEEDAIEESKALDKLKFKGSDKKTAGNVVYMIKRGDTPKEIASIFKKLKTASQETIMTALGDKSSRDLLQKGKLLNALIALFDEADPKGLDGRSKAFREKLRKLEYNKKKNLPYEMFEKTVVKEKKLAGLEKKADKSGMPYGILKQVFNRGVAAWRTGHRPGTNPTQWGYARVNSFVTKSKGTWGGADKDLAAKVKK